MPGVRTLVAGFNLTLVVAAVVRQRRQLAVVAGFTALTHAVAANRHAHARLARAHARPAVLDHAAVGGAAVASGLVHVVAGFVAFDDAVAADHDLDALFTDR